MKDTLQRLAAGAILALAAGYVLYVGRGILIPLVLGLFIAWILWTLVSWLRAAPVIGRYLPNWFAHVIALALVGGVIWGLVLLVTQNVAQIEQRLPIYHANLEALLARLAPMIGLHDAPTLEQLLDEWVGRLDLHRLAGSAVGLVTAMLGSLAVVMVYTGFALLEKASMVGKLKRLAGSAAGGERMVEALREISERIGSYLLLKTLVSALVGVLSWVIMRLIGIDFAGFWAVLIFVLNFIPYVGSFIAVLLPVTLTLVQFDTLGPFIAALVSLTAAQVVVGNVVEPSLMGHSLNLSPLIIMLSLATWSALWGVVGAFLCVPITVVMLIVFAEFQSTRPLAILLSQNGCIDSGRRSTRSA